MLVPHTHLPACTLFNGFRRHAYTVPDLILSSVFVLLYSYSAGLSVLSRENLGYLALFGTALLWGSWTPSLRLLYQIEQ